MSHIAAIDVAIKTIQAAKNATKELGGTFMENQTTFRCYTASESKCVHAIRPPGWKPGDYEIGLKMQPDGSLVPYFDNFVSGNNIARLWGGPKCLKFTQAYKAHATILACKARGHHNITRKTNAKTGEIKVFI